ncbi:hypothetical protein GIS00_12520 [Nakamurella sp. YIM 132087]|uniref:Uncharacterized protein n=1 Tax=Nakamurella alba TaxID=2665158 RepID=A0A7K1FPK9_9ACTN|nr:hypothetical protein [Nakamurella alba]MTD14764.1 hypothetical protein [Nakamurella alba]
MSPVNDDEIDRLLRTAVLDAADAESPVPRPVSLLPVVDGGRPAGRRRRAWWLAPLGVAAAVALAVGITMLVRPASAPVGTSEPLSACAPVPSRVLPEWARGGFSDPEPEMPYVLGDAGNIVAILFVDPMIAPTPDGSGNKILWVPHTGATPGADLRITGTLEGAVAGSAGSTMSAVVAGGPGPSGIEAPRAGCWLLQLAWGDTTDSMALRWYPPDTPASR